jgi:hypothetical protein
VEKSEWHIITLFVRIIEITTINIASSKLPPSSHYQNHHHQQNCFAAKIRISYLAAISIILEMGNK